MMATEIFYINATRAEKLMKKRVSFLAPPTVCNAYYTYILPSGGCVNSTFLSSSQTNRFISQQSWFLKNPSGADWWIQEPESRETNLLTNKCWKFASQIDSKIEKLNWHIIITIFLILKETREFRNKKDGKELKFWKCSIVTHTEPFRLNLTLEILGPSCCCPPQSYPPRGSQESCSPTQLWTQF